MPALADILDLRLAVSDLVGSREISDVMARIVLLAETTLNRRLRTQWQIKSFDPAWTGNEAPLPADFLQLVASDDRLQALDGALYRKPYRTWPGGVAYYAALPTLTAGPGTSNWLLAQFPDAYLYAAAYHAAKHLNQAELATGLDQALAAELLAVRVEDERARYSNHAVRTAGPTP